jgi:hypothetical protein
MSRKVIRNETNKTMLVPVGQLTLDSMLHAHDRLVVF